MRSEIKEQVRKVYDKSPLKVPEITQVQAKLKLNNKSLAKPSRHQQTMSMTLKANGGDFGGDLQKQIKQDEQAIMVK